MKTIHCAAVDLGATSGRVIVGSWNGRRLDLTEIRRFPNAFHDLAGRAYWNLGGLWHEVRTGLIEARKRFPKLASVGIDTWGVDHVLVDDDGRLVYPPHAYRDSRTRHGLKRLGNTRAALERVYQATGIPNVFYNTSLQLEETVASSPAVADSATRCLFLPDYFNFLLSGRMENEISMASTTQLLDVQTGDWSRATLDHFHIPPHWFTKPIKADTVLGSAKCVPELKGVKVVAVAGHDTASAYAAMPTTGDGDDLYISSGTWSLVGFESDAPLLGPDALAARVANERMGDGRFRPLTNVIGLWLLEQTLRDLDQRPCNDREWAALVAQASERPAPTRLLDTSDPAFVNPKSMRAAVDAHLKKLRQPIPKDCAGYVRLICDSLGRGHAEVAATFQRLSGRAFKRILMVGGGSRNTLLCQATADAAGIPLHAFELEGTAVGNIASQLVALKAVKNLAAFRGLLARRISPRIHEPTSR
ncbi:rhamnulokinase [Opitutales bacterium ASA1]|uniref:rhamnulokinase n=1 Tax=Congregicoccus parvus TaxID=3081749 RepID=UPI002B310800|nr:rhamnulokinase [Opitutales bacterium ASA1]